MAIPTAARARYRVTVHASVQVIPSTIVCTQYRPGLRRAARVAEVVPFGMIVRSNLAPETSYSETVPAVTTGDCMTTMGAPDMLRVTCSPAGWERELWNVVTAAEPSCSGGRPAPGLTTEHPPTASTPFTLFTPRTPYTPPPPAHSPVVES
jgi:hypothetical protein